MKKIITIYAIVSLLLSVAFTATGDYRIVRHRAPFLVVDFAWSTSTGSGHGYDHRGDYIASYDLPAGENFLAVMVYNPLNNYCDDIMARFDL